MKQNKQKFTGPYGFIKSALGIVEEQTNGNLHFHGMLFGGWDFDVIQQHIHKSNVAKKFTDLIDSQITCEISQQTKDAFQRKEKLLKQLREQNKVLRQSNKPEKPLPPQRLFASESCPKVKDIKKYAETVAIHVQHHEHSWTCWKDNAKTCRMGMPQSQADKSYFAEIWADPKTNKPAKKFPPTEPQISEFIKPYRKGNPFEPEDQRKIIFGHARKDEIEQKMAPFQPITTACASYNTSMQVLVAPAEAKTAMFYITKYLSKNPNLLQKIIPLMAQADKELKLYGSKAKDAGTAKRNAKCVLQKILHKTGQLEMSAQQVAAGVMDEKSEFSSHAFKFMFIWSILKQYRQSLKKYNFKDYDSEYESSNESDDEEDIIDSEDEEEIIDSEDEENDEIMDPDDEEGFLLTLHKDAENGKPIAFSNHEKYMNRGPALKNLCLYAYTGIIGDAKNEKSKNSENGRHESSKFPFLPGTKVAKALQQVIMSVCRIPRIAGPKPPPYPGPRPSGVDDVWTKNAKLFVEFYSLMFLPLDDNGLPFDPTDKNIKILPWEDKTFDSWENFWNILCSWDVDTGENPYTKFYKRHMWQIFENMVFNLNQGNGDRRLLRDWRHQCATTRPSVVPTDPNKRSGRNYINSL
ncbi:MAG: hypothetical protein GY739_18095, partial [Mesoflavibacter sp.]|nr:hypothetical protein [Mesoflavibacter sp.]